MHRPEEVDIILVLFSLTRRPLPYFSPQQDGEGKRVV